ncbi:MAG: hypothetical protein ACC635_02200 [Acidiferrobacterales bacterium]
MLRFVGIILLILPFSVAAESVYVTDQLTIGIFSGPNEQPPELKRANSGDLLEVVERAEGAVKVRDAAGIEGWVSVNLVSSAKPVRAQLGATRAEVDRLQLALTATKAQLQSLNVRLKEAQNGLSEEKNRALDLTSQLTEATVATELANKEKIAAQNTPSQTSFISADIAYGMWILISFAMLVGGFIIGYSWVREKYRRKLGGMNLRL